MTDIEARAALRDVVPRLVALLRGVPATSPALGSWTVGDVAAHLSHVFRFDIDALAGNPVPEAVVTAAGMSEVNAKLLAEDDERDPAALALRLGALADEFDEVASSSATTVDWLQGIRLASSTVACHLLEECLIHGYDIARATGQAWPIRREHALLAVEGGVFPLVEALPPTAFVTPGSFRGRFELRLRGGGRTVMAFDRGALTLASERGDVDAYISADPAALMLVFIGRQGIVKPLLEGKLAGWGWRPWKLVPMLAAINPP